MPPRKSTQQVNAGLTTGWRSDSAVAARRQRVFATICCDPDWLAFNLPSDLWNPRCAGGNLLCRQFSLLLFRLVCLIVLIGMQLLLLRWRPSGDVGEQLVALTNLRAVNLLGVQLYFLLATVWSGCGLFCAKQREVEMVRQPPPRPPPPSLPLLLSQCPLREQLSGTTAQRNAMWMAPPFCSCVRLRLAAHSGGGSGRSATGRAGLDAAALRADGRHRRCVR